MAKKKSAKPASSNSKPELKKNSELSVKGKKRMKELGKVSFGSGNLKEILKNNKS